MIYIECMNILNFCILLFIVTVANLHSDPSDSTIIRDTTFVSSFKRSNGEITISFDNKNLADKNTRLVFNELFKQYLAIKDALVYNDSYGAVSNTLKLLDDMKSKTKNIEVLNKDDRWVLFLNNFDGIKKKVESTTFISEQRFLFNEITLGIREFLKQYGLSDRTVYLMQSPDKSSEMTGNWLSSSRDKKNPYMGLPDDTANIKVKEIWMFK